MKHFARHQGFLMFIAVILIVVLGLFGVSAVYLFSGGSLSSVDQLKTTQAMFIAEGALERAAHLLNITTDLSYRSSCSSIGSNAALPGGSSTLLDPPGTTSAYTVSGTAASPTTFTTLSSAITSSVTAIPVASTTGYASKGQIMIDKELINYASTTATSFVGAIRGIGGTTAAAHASGAPIGQYQCNLTVNAGVPNLSAPVGKRTLTASVPLLEGWAVGQNNSGSNSAAFHINKPTELAASATTVGLSVMLNGVSAVSNGDVWAVGNSARVARWNGSSWSSQTVSSANYNAIHCLASNSCWAVGSAISGRAGIIGYNGASWSVSSPTGGPASDTLYAVHCSASNNCWAAGNQNGRFYFYNGTNWSRQNVAGLNGQPFRGIFCNSASDCWAVKGNTSIARYNGSSWSQTTYSIPNVQYYGIYCNGSTDCWAVGDAQSNSSNVFIRWNGTTWTRDTSSLTPASDLRSVTCTNANDCWAVGEIIATAAPAFFHWNGSVWEFVPFGGLPDADLRSVAIVNPGQQQPITAWQETIP